MASGSLRSTVVAPRRACSRIAASCLTAQARHLRGTERAVLAGLHPPELERAQGDPLERDHGMTNRLAHPPHLALAALAQGDVEHARPRLLDQCGQRRAVVEDDALA